MHFHGPGANRRRLDIDVLHVVVLIRQPASYGPAALETITQIAVSLRWLNYQIQVVDQMLIRRFNGGVIGPHQGDLEGRNRRINNELIGELFSGLQAVGLVYELMAAVCGVR